MALYFYKALSKTGKRVSGTIDAPSSQAAKEQLANQGLYPTEIVPEGQKVAGSWWRSLFAKSLKPKERILFTKQLAVLLKSGVPLLQALELLVEQFEGSSRTMLVAIKDNVKQGTSLADALKQYPKSFEPIYIQLVRAGEASGKLEIILERLTSYLERKEEMGKRIRGALTQPVMQLGMAVLVVGFLLVFVVPTMTENFKETGKTLPASTRLLVGMSTILTRYFVLILGALVGVILLFNYWKSTPSGRRTLDALLLRLPFVGFYTRMNAVVQFCYTLGMLLEGGVNLAESLDIVVSIIDNKILAQALEQARDKIVKQGKISQYLKQTNLFPPIAIYLISTGEETGQLDKMLLTIATNYETELAEWADGLTAKLGPILLVIMGLIVGFIVLSIALPIMQMSEVPMD